MLMEIEEDRHFLFLCGEKDTGNALISFRLEVAAYTASLPGRVKSFIFIARPLVAHPVKG